MKNLNPDRARQWNPNPLTGPNEGLDLEKIQGGINHGKQKF